MYRIEANICITGHAFPRTCGRTPGGHNAAAFKVKLDLKSMLALSCRSSRFSITSLISRCNSNCFSGQLSIICIRSLAASVIGCAWFFKSSRNWCRCSFEWRFIRSSRSNDMVACWIGNTPRQPSVWCGYRYRRILERYQSAGIDSISAFQSKSGAALRAEPTISVSIA